MYYYGVALDERTRTITCWIPFENRKVFFFFLQPINLVFTETLLYQLFAVCGQNTVSEHDYALIMHLDKHPCSSYHMSRGWTGERSVSYCRISATEVRDFRFGSLESIGMIIPMVQYHCLRPPDWQMTTDIWSDPPPCKMWGKSKLKFIE